MHSVKLTKVYALKRGKAVDSDALIFRNNDHLPVVLCELETADDAAYVDLVLEDDRVGAVDHDVVAILAHDTKERLMYKQIFFRDDTLLAVALLMDW